MTVLLESLMRPVVRASVLLTLVAFATGPSSTPGADAAVGARPTSGVFAVAPSASLQSCGNYDDYAPRGFEYYFTRGVYSGGGRGRRFGFGRGRGGSSWATDYPKADRQFLVVAQRLAHLDSYPCENPVRLDDPEIRRYPFLYILEIGSMGMTDAEVEGLRSYLLAGGFLVIDDFWGDYAWLNLQSEMARVFPEYPIVDIPMDHDVFKTFYTIDAILQVPSINNARYGNYSECGPCRPFARGMFDEEGRLMMVINGNTDLGDAWEWAEQPDYPLDRSTYAIEMGINMIIYSMSH